MGGLLGSRDARMPSAWVQACGCTCMPATLVIGTSEMRWGVSHSGWYSGSWRAQRCRPPLPDSRAISIGRLARRDVTFVTYLPVASNSSCYGQAFSASGVLSMFRSELSHVRSPSWAPNPRLRNGLCTSSTRRRWPGNALQECGAVVASAAAPPSRSAPVFASTISCGQPLIPYEQDEQAHESNARGTRLGAKPAPPGHQRPPIELC